MSQRELVAAMTSQLQGQLVEASNAAADSRCVGQLINLININLSYDLIAGTAP